MLLFAIRALHRVVFGSAITDAFGISSSRNMINMVIPVDKIDYVQAQDDYVCFRSEGKD